jgi:hypothetical protein
VRGSQRHVIHVLETLGWIKESARAEAGTVANNGMIDQGVADASAFARAMRCCDFFML